MRTALKNESEDEETTSVTVVNWKESNGNTHNVVATTREATLKKIIEKDTPKVGWTSCRVKEVIRNEEKIRCYKCYSYGHENRKCRNEGEDRR